MSRHAFGNFKDLLREMTLNPSMGKYLDLGNSIAPAPNENDAREMMQLFTIGPVQLNRFGADADMLATQVFKNELNNFPRKDLGLMG